MNHTIHLLTVLLLAPLAALQTNRTLLAVPRYCQVMASNGWK